MKPSYLYNVICTAIVIGLAASVIMWSASSFLLLWLTFISTALCGVSFFHLVARRGYSWVKYFPLISLPIWLIPILVVGGCIGLFANGMEGTRIDTPLDIIRYLIMAAVVISPVWLLIFRPFQRALKNSDIEDEFMANDRQYDTSRRSIRRKLLLGVTALIVIGLFAFAPVGCQHTRLIHVAAEHGWPTVTRLLIAAGTPVDIRTTDGDTPLHIAADQGWVGVIEVLISSHASINARDNIGRTALRLAIAGINPGGLGSHSPHDFDSDCRRDAALYLIKQGADVRIGDYDGITPMRRLIQMYKPDPDLMRLLIDHGADVNTKDTTGHTLLDRAIEDGNSDEVRLLMDKGARRSSHARKHGFKKSHVKSR